MENYMQYLLSEEMSLLKKMTSVLYLDGKYLLHI